MTKTHFRIAFRLTTPVLFGYLALGMGFGLMISARRYPLFLTPFMSIFMYAGAGQYVAVGLFAAGTPLSMILITEALVNIRHIVYGLSLISKLKGAGAWKTYIVFALTDETYSILTAANVPDGADSGAFYGTIALLDHAYWIFGTVLGSLLGSALESKTALPLGGVDFALTALFAVLLIDRIKQSKDFAPPLIGAACTVMAIVLSKRGVFPDGSAILPAALAAGVVCIAVIKAPRRADCTKAFKTADSSPSFTGKNTTEQNALSAKPIASVPVNARSAGGEHD
jgi:Predicted branched-chain amino acid permease (azaleucine resistance)